MFVHRRRKIQEPEFHDDLEKLGLFINNNDELRQIANPTEGFVYKFFTDKRLNERRREAVNTCLRRHILSKLKDDLGLVEARIRVENHHTYIPILHTPDIGSKSKCMIFFNDYNTDLGIWSYRAVEGDGANITTGSMIAMTRHAIENGFSVVIGNSGVSHFDPETDSAITQQTWEATRLPWKYGGPIRVYDATWNTIKGSESTDNHVKTVMEMMVDQMTPEDVKLFVVAAGLGASAVMQYFDTTFSSQWNTRLYALALAEPAITIESLNSELFEAFLLNRCRVFTSGSNKERGEQIGDLRFGCCVYSADTIHQDLIIPLCQDIILEYFDLALANPDNCNPHLMMEEPEEQKVPFSDEQPGYGSVWGDGSTPGGGW